MARRAERPPHQVRETVPGVGGQQPSQAAGATGPDSLPLSRPCVYARASAQLVHWDLRSKHVGVRTAGRLLPKCEPPSGF